MKTYRVRVYHTIQYEHDVLVQAESKVDARKKAREISMDEEWDHFWDKMEVVETTALTVEETEDGEAD